jgi:hypothetical protein
MKNVNGYIVTFKFSSKKQFLYHGALAPKYLLNTISLTQGGSVQPGPIPSTFLNTWKRSKIFLN